MRTSIARIRAQTPFVLLFLGAHVDDASGCRIECRQAAKQTMSSDSNCGRRLTVVTGGITASQVRGPLCGDDVRKATGSWPPDRDIHLANFAAARLTIDQFGAIAARLLGLNISHGRTSSDSGCGTGTAVDVVPHKLALHRDACPQNRATPAEVLGSLTRASLHRA